MSTHEELKGLGPEAINIGGERVGIDFRGSRVEVLKDPEGNVLYMMCLALLSLEDARVDTVMRIFDVRLFDADEKVIWPPVEGAEKEEKEKSNGRL